MSFQKKVKEINKSMNSKKAYKSKLQDKQKQDREDEAIKTYID